MRSAQIIDIARLYPPQPKESEYPVHNFFEALEESASAAPTTSRASTKRTHVTNVDRVEDSKDLDIHSPSSDDDDGAMFLAKPLDSRPPPRAGKRTLPNFGLDASEAIALEFLSGWLRHILILLQPSDLRMRKPLGVYATVNASSFELMMPPSSGPSTRRRKPSRMRR
jgi:hypothetical protein